MSNSSNTGVKFMVPSSPPSEGYIEGRNVTVERRYSVSRPSNEIGRESRPDIVGDHLRRAELSIPQSAQTGESLLLARDVVRHAGEGLAAHHIFASPDFGQCVSGVDAVILHIWARGVHVDDDRCSRGAHGDLQPMGGRCRVAAAGEVV